MSHPPPPPPGSAPGWYSDGTGKNRWWDGARWTDHLAPPPEPTVVRPAPERPTPTPPSAAETVMAPHRLQGQAPVTAPPPAPAPRPTPGPRSATPTHVVTPPPRSGPGFVGGLVVGVLLLALAGGGYWWWQQRDDDGDGSSSGSPTEKVSGPQQAVESYYAKVESMDCGFVELVTERYAREAQADACPKDPETYFSEATVDGGNFQIGQIDISGDMAVAKVRFLVDGVAIANGTTTLVRRDGDWRVDREEFVAA